jgi:hypothetical protein
MPGDLTRRAFLRFGAIGAVAGLSYAWDARTLQAQANAGADMILFNGHLATQDERRSFASAAAIKDGRFLAVGATRTCWRIGTTGRR